MHDWTLISIAFEWQNALVTLTLLNSKSEQQLLIAKNATKLLIPKREEWGRSVSVNKIDGPVGHLDGTEILQIEMQTGDVIEIVADSFVIPFR